MDIFGTVSNVIGLSRVVIDYLWDVKDAGEECRILWSEVAVLKELLPILEKRLKDSKNKVEMQDVVNTLSTPLKQLQESLTYLKDGLERAQRRGRKLIWPFSKKGITKDIAHIERLKSYAILALQDSLLVMADAIKNDLANTCIGVNDIKSGVAEILLKQEDQQYQELANWISPLSFCAKQHSSFEACTEGTSTWILQTQEFQDWVIGKSKILWCPGNPGVGKTIIASVVINHLQDRCESDGNSVVLFIYCDYKMQHDTSQLMEALLRQLALHRTMTFDSIASLKEYKRNGHRPSLKVLMTMLQTEIMTYSRAYIVIDALDESFEKHRPLILASLRSLTVRSSANLVITSRHIPSIERDICPDIKLKIVASEIDIRGHVLARISGDNDLKQLVTRAPSIEEEVVTKVARKAQGMFLLAQLHMDTLSAKSSRTAILDALEVLPEDFKSTYNNAMERINLQSPNRRQLAYHVLSWISYAFRHLSLIELQHALATKEGMTKIDENDLDNKSILISVCGGLVTVSEGSQEVCLVHYTLEEYLQHARKGGDPFLSPVNLAIRCFVYLSFDWQVHVDDEVLGTSFLHYAAQGWGEHSHGFYNPDIIKYAKKLLYDDVKIKMVAKILTLDKKPHVKDGNTTGLHLCSYLGLEHIAKSLFLDRQCSDLLNMCDTIFCQSPIFLAARHGHVGMMKLLLKTVQIEVDTRDNLSGHSPLSLAAMNGHEKVVRLLTKVEQVEINAKDRIYGRTPLHWAARNGYEKVTKVLLRTGQAEVNVRDKQNYHTPLHLSALCGSIDVVKTLLDNDQIDIEAKDVYGQTPLSLAARIGREKIVEVLLGPADKNTRDSVYGQTPFHWAAEFGHENVIKVFLKTKQVNLDIRDTEYGRTALSLAAMMGPERVVKLLLQTNQVDINTRDAKYGRTPLALAALNGRERVVKLLLEKSQIEVDARDRRYSQTPLSLAAMNGFDGVVKLLFKSNQANVDAKDYYGKTPLHWAAENGCDKVVKFLVEKGYAKVNARDQIFGQTPLHWASENGRYWVVDYLIKIKEVRVDARDITYGRTPFGLASMNGHERVVNRLLQTGQVDINIWDVKYGRTPLSLAAMNGRERVVKLLLKTGQVDTESRDKMLGQTAFSLAAMNGCSQVMKILFEIGHVNINAVDNNYGWTPLHWASGNGCKDAVKFLLETGQVNIDAREYMNNKSPLSLAAEFGHEEVVKLFLLTDQERI